MLDCAARGRYNKHKYSSKSGRTRRFGGQNMDNSKLERINALAKKAKTEGLTEEEIIERDALRREYIQGFRQGLINQLDNVYIVDENGNKTKLERKH